MKHGRKPQYMASTDSFYIRLTCPCDYYPIAPYFYIVKLGFTSVYNFLIFALNINCGYSIEEAVLTSTHNVCFRAKIRKHHNFSSEYFLFYSRENSSILHWRVFVMMIDIANFSYKTSSCPVICHVRRRRRPL